MDIAERAEVGRATFFRYFGDKQEVVFGDDREIDAAFQRAVDAGARQVEAVQTFVTGDRYGTVIDPFGHRWAILTKVEEVSKEEADRRVQEWLASTQES